MTIYPTATNYSEHFTKRELSCHCGCRTPAKIAAELVKTAASLELLRTAVGEPLYVNSGYRCPAYNRQIGGAEDSQHMYGTAADVTAQRKSPSNVAALAERIPVYANGGIGRYDGFTHVDRRSYKARWVG